MKRHLMMAAAAPLALLLSACNQPPQNAAEAGEKVDAAAKTALTEAQAAYDRVNQRMHEGMARIDVDADVAFMRGMLAHHKGAVEMSEVALKYGKDPKARDLAERIIKAQKAEIAEMEAWLAARKTARTAAPADTGAAADRHANH